MTRQCGGCTLCCKLLPVKEIKKPAGQRCEHQRFKGCAIYQQRPYSCAMWNCRWRTGDDTAELSRPDRSHYVLDVMPDFITVTDSNDNDREIAKVEVVQVWLDPAHPDAHKDPALRRYLERRGQEGIAALVRLNSSEGFVMFPPPMCSDGQWHIKLHSKILPQRSSESWAQGIREARGG